MVDIIRALEAIHSPSSSNELRKEALSFVESLKESDAAARNGFLLASRTDHAYVVRYFGLTLLDHVLRHLSFSDSEASANIRPMILQLAENITADDPSYFRNKIPQLWSEAAKKSWGLDWMDMDEALVKFWGSSLVHNELVLAVLETLSEDVFFREDTVSSLRGSELNRALVEIFTPAAIVEQIQSDKKANAVPRCGQEGWLVRICEFLDNCVQNVSSSPQARDSAVKALTTLRSALSWSVFKAVVASQVVSAVFRSLTCQDEQVLLVRDSSTGVSMRNTTVMLMEVNRPQLRHCTRSTAGATWATKNHRHLSVFSLSPSTSILFKACTSGPSLAQTTLMSPST